MITALCLLLSAVLSVTPAPGDALMAEMILVELAQQGEMYPSESRTDHGQCRCFQHDSFAQSAEGYMLAAYPDASLYLPLEHADSQASGRPAGVSWDMPDASTGNAFVEVARFDYDRSLTQKENLAAAREFLKNVRAGDLMQMLGTYNSGGRGTHTILFTQPYDPRSPMLYWADSNFANTRIDGKRYGYVRAYQSWRVDEVAAWISADQDNGATLYRLRDDIVKRP